MKLKLSLIFVSILFITTSVFAFDIPNKPRGYVHDDAGVLSSPDAQDLDQRLRAFDKGSSTQIVVAIFPSLDGESLEDLTVRMAQQWKIGSKENDNGVLLAIFTGDRKLRIEVGYGLEGVLTDLHTDQIIRNVIVPEFKKGKMDVGVIKGANAIMQAAQGEYELQERSSSSNENNWIIWVVFGLFILISIFGKKGRGRRGSRNSSWGSSSTWSSGSSSGGFSGGGGSFGGGGSSGSW